ncbi:hypothetical protein [Microbulbifer epialgicus]|uniref:RNA helicase n=1 Tax=Microbulbifer epialgicus TaxID=393907 RepID=A0ABV4NZA5_9GAMM
MNEENTQETEDRCCGLVMPISAIDGCNEQHWLEVKQILTASVEGAGFKANLVSYADDVGIIQKRIIQNLYNNPIVVCDVSGKNPNVMFELGMRLAFDKPTIIIKDDKTSYSFDTSQIEHLDYPRDLRFSKIVEFKEALREKILATVQKSQEDENYTTFLKHFGTFTVAKLDTKEVSKEDYIIAEMKELKMAFQGLTKSNSARANLLESIYISDEPTEFRMNMDNQGVIYDKRKGSIPIITENIIRRHPRRPRQKITESEE